MNKQIDFLNSLGDVVAIIGSQYGDEGKGKLIDVLAAEYRNVFRGTGGSNAGHTIVVNGEKFVFHLLPSGILYSENVCVIGNGCVLHLPTLLKELDNLKAKNINFDKRLFVSNKAHIVFDFHMEIDGMQEEQKGDQKVGTTKRGIGPTYTDKIARMGVRVADLYNEKVLRSKLEVLVSRNRGVYNIKMSVDDLLAEYLEMGKTIKPFVIDTVDYLHNVLDKSEKVLLEGANAHFLDIDHGTYPFVTSSNASIAGLLSGVGCPPTRLTDVIGIVKAYTSRVGDGPFLTELFDEIGEQIREVGREFGSTTGRPRRCGWIDTFMLRSSARLNGFNHLNLTKLDVLSGLPTLKIATKYMLEGVALTSMPADNDILTQVEVVYEEMPGWTEDISSCRKFEDLPLNAQKYCLRVEELIGVPIKVIGVGPDREEMIYLS